MATCETNGHLWNSQRKCIMCKCDRPEEPDTYLQELRAIAVEALERPIDPQTPRHQRDLVVEAETVIELIDQNAELLSLRERVGELEGREKLFLIAIRWMAANGIYFDDDMESWRDRIDYRVSIPIHLAPLIAEATKQEEQSDG